MFNYFKSKRLSSLGKLGNFNFSKASLSLQLLVLQKLHKFCLVVTRLVKNLSCNNLNNILWFTLLLFFIHFFTLRNRIVILNLFWRILNCIFLVCFLYFLKSLILSLVCVFLIRKNIFFLFFLIEKPSSILIIKIKYFKYWAIQL